MRIRHRDARAIIEPDMTPMIDVTFQLIAFFMFVLNFSDAETDERIRLPLSQLAKPPEVAPEQPITLQVSRTGTVYITGDEVPLDKIKPYLQREVQLLDRQNKDQANTTIILRGDAEVQTGKVQELIKQCQETGFERFSLRAKQPDR
ncbi:MAG: biopolymer transporter ExbD [Pirellulales bacterium]